MYDIGKNNKRYDDVLCLITHEGKVVFPLIDHVHNDKENGQPEFHYHVDDRYVGYSFPRPVRVNLPLEEGTRLEYRKLERKKKFVHSRTKIEDISKSKLKHKCIHKGKCPHRGFDLSTIEPNNKGIITCPLHSLQFDFYTKQLI